MFGAQSCYPRVKMGGYHCLSWGVKHNDYHPSVCHQLGHRRTDAVTIRWTGVQLASGVVVHCLESPTLGLKEVSNACRLDENIPASFFQARCKPQVALHELSIQGLDGWGQWLVLWPAHCSLIRFPALCGGQLRHFFRWVHSRVHIFGHRGYFYGIDPLLGFELGFVRLGVVVPTTHVQGPQFRGVVLTCSRIKVDHSGFVCADQVEPAQHFSPGKRYYLLSVHGMPCPNSMPLLGNASLHMDWEMALVRFICNEVFNFLQKFNSIGGT
mmetsp:Transcript_30729/g.40597  ORF Transcript_30729/g.40597 Transcript_30729/m.40597 type:complete len:269 (-) Transcript_30729:1503-2309(-)